MKDLLRNGLKKIKTKVKILKIKWVLGQCHSICIWCKYKHECHSNME